MKFCVETFMDSTHPWIINIIYKILRALSRTSFRNGFTHNDISKDCLNSKISVVGILIGILMTVFLYL